MSDHTIKIDGLTPQQYQLLMSPTRDLSSAQGKMGGKKVHWFPHGMHVISNFFARLFYAVFVTHLWENDHSLMNHLWRDLKNDKVNKDAERILRINAIFESLKERLPANDADKIRVEQKLIRLNNHFAKQERKVREEVEVIKTTTAMNEMVGKLNSTLNTRGRNEIRQKVIEQLIERNLPNSDVESLYQSLKKAEDLEFVKAQIKIIKALGTDHPLLDKELILVNLLYALNATEDSFSKSTREIVLKGVVEQGLEKGVALEHLQKIVDALDSLEDKELMKSFMPASEKKKIPAIEPLDLEELAEKLSGAHPYKSDYKALGLIYKFNHPEKFISTGTEDTLEGAVLMLANELIKSEWKDEFLGLVASKEMKKKLKQKAGLLKEGDLVCDYSQGRIADIAPESGLTNADGKNACSSICAEAVFLLDQQKKEGIATEESLYEVIRKGVSSHKAKGYGSEAAVFSELVEEVNKEREAKEKHLRAFAPKPDENGELLDFFAEERYLNPLLYPYESSVNMGFEGYLNMVKNLSEENKQRIYGVITCGAETVLVYYNADESLMLLDSHGRNYLGVPKGASIRKFKNVKELDQHLQSMYKGTDPYSMLMIGVE